MCTKGTVYVYKKDGLRVQKGRRVCSADRRREQKGGIRWYKVDAGSYLYTKSKTPPTRERCFMPYCFLV